MTRALIAMPKTAKAGDIVEVKIILSHPMETGYRMDESGKPVPRHIVKDLVCRYLGDEVFRVELFPAISANPYFSFFLTAERTGSVVLAWTDDRGERGGETLNLKVE
jgi:sulfur-oxidizing protein SoxZ